MENPFWFDHVYAGLVLVGMLYAVFASQPRLKQHEYDTSAKVALYWSNSVFLYLLAGAAVGVWLWGGRQLETLGFRWPHPEFVVVYTMLVIVFLVWYAIDLWIKLGTPAKRAATHRRWRSLTPHMPETPREVAHALHLALCAGVTEEIVFRGFLINYFMSLLAPLFHWSPFVAVLIPAIIFGAAHRYTGKSEVVKIVFLATVFGLVFVLSGSLLIIVALHALIDIIAVLISPSIMAGPKVK